jgi:protocatechuate 3,4-dioxygenase, beta subunit
MGSEPNGQRGNRSSSPLVLSDMLQLLAVVAAYQDRPSPEWRPLLDAPAGVTHELRIPSPTHAGPSLEIRGRVLRADRKTPVPGVILYFHHTDAQGSYPRPTGSKPSQWIYWHGSLRGWLKTDASGQFILRTTRPGPYPRRRDPAHIHVYGLLPGSRTGLYFSDLVFAGDAFLTSAYWDSVRRQGLEVYGGLKLVESAAGVHIGQKDLILPR